MPMVRAFYAFVSFSATWVNPGSETRNSETVLGGCRSFGSGQVGCRRPGQMAFALPW